MSDTPETDAEVNELKSAVTYNMVHVGFARQLERERNIAHKAMGDARDILLDAMPDANAPTKILAEMIVAERDSNQRQADALLLRLGATQERMIDAERERDAAKDNVRKLAVSLADSIRFSLARQDETEEAMHECSELRILVDGLLEMNQKLSDEHNSYYNELLTKRGLCKVQEQVITDWKSEAEKWRAIANDNRD